ncbi:hypothetical protein [Streptomyces acidiscabies]|uniref:Uncharacterized protein n=1 Tax=Streptomyces acidiscabies TaxID=42234 RepID=A0AAP6B4S6_9ACTN|nr:hypothetical protein [Streptomyces acidiscabies]MBP5941367.1 hypothetical protein [Streptomyces sp. LBUM 1476]MBZ3912729.1 hypothetical protein [Streptomyces acidiscabies]MDX2958213.1 hypothetical protein [Streptomyces acidiscabies]MDX3018580.1 hypothetical protein [Streptomyces acidiscabies]MDX3791117.1 hypothetical protein [Streptomyces acidiscabies]
MAKAPASLRATDELAEAGYQWLELGPYGYLPTDPQKLRAELEARGAFTEPPGTRRPVDGR